MVDQKNTGKPATANPAAPKKARKTRVVAKRDYFVAVVDPEAPAGFTVVATKVKVIDTATNAQEVRNIESTIMAQRWINALGDPTKEYKIGMTVEGVCKPKVRKAAVVLSKEAQVI